MKPQIIIGYEEGTHNKELTKTHERLVQQGAYRDQRTIIVVPAFGTVPTVAVSSWWNLMTPPNQGVAKIFALGMEVGEAYSQTFEAILSHPELSKWPYILTLEHDNVPPPDGILKLLERMDSNPQFAAIGGLYFTKGYGGVPQIWGNPLEFPLNFQPQLPDLNGGLVECNGTGMGFTMFRTSMFRDDRLRRPWFKTVASTTEGMGTQDLWFARDARSKGYRFAVDCSVKVGHYDAQNEIMW